MKQGSNPRRSRGRGGARRENSPRNQSIESNGPEVRIRGTVSQVLEKYLALARDASSAGDHVSAENYLQHAEHYYRLMNGNGQGSSGGQKHRGQGRSRGNGADAGTEPAAAKGDGGDPASGEATSSAPKDEPATSSSDPETGTPDTSSTSG